MNKQISHVEPTTPQERSTTVFQLPIPEAKPGKQDTEQSSDRQGGVTPDGKPSFPNAAPQSGSSKAAAVPAKTKKLPARDDTERGRPIPPFIKKVAPWPEVVEPEALLNAIQDVIRRHVVLDEPQAVAATLWIAMTWFMDTINVAPLALITAPEKACGKSQLLFIFQKLVCHPLASSNATASFLFRAIAAWLPTLLIDEADTFIRQDSEIKGIINAGHTRESAWVGRTEVVNDNFEPTMFNVWSAKAFAGIALEKHLPPATMSRGIVISLRRKLADETIVRLRHADQAEFDELAAKLARFAADYAGQVACNRPAPPPELGDRDQDNWEPLLGIAQCAGPEWLADATAAAITLSAKDDDSDSAANGLLADIRDIFESKQTDKISTADLIGALTSDDERPWATYNRGKPLTPRQLGKMLDPYGIKSKTVRFGRHTPKGFDIEQFEDTFQRYLGSSSNSQPSADAFVDDLAPPSPEPNPQDLEF